MRPEQAEYNCIQLPGYDCVAQGRSSSASGGLITYLDNSFKHEIISNINKYTLWEGLILQIKRGGLPKGLIIGNKLSDHQPCFIILDITFCGCNNPKFIRKYVQLESVIDNINSDICSSGLDDKIDTGMTADPNISYSIIHDVIEKTQKDSYDK